MVAKPLSGMGVKLLNQTSGMPQMSAAFSGWKISMVLKKITQTIVNGFTVDSATVLTVQGVWQPMTAQKIALKPEGQRAWSWFTLHVEGNNVDLKVNDVVEYNGVRYKVMNNTDYSLNNYMELDLILDFQNNA